MSERDDELDRFLTGAMLAREVPPASGNLASLALARVRAADARKVPLARLGRWIRVSCVAAAVIAGAVLVAGYGFYKAGSSGDGSTAVVTDTSGESSTDWSEVGLLVLGVAVVGMVGRMVLLPERQAEVAVR